MALSFSVILYFRALGGSRKAIVSGRKRKPARKGIDKNLGLPHTETMLQLSGNSTELEAALGSLVDLRKGDSAVLDRIDLPGDDARRLMELGFLPGTRVIAGCCAPGGDPRVFQVDGSEIALRRETARKLKVRPETTLHKSAKAPRIV
jgi:Fe2+ transport system protein FeoA